MTPVAAPSLSALDIACGLVFDRRPARRPRRLPVSGASPQQALSDTVLPALLRAPCLVSFSGGRDSSLVLAVATRVARQEGLADPIPVTNRFADAPAADESRWQEQVVEHLRLADWQRLRFSDELDAVGPYAQRMLRAHGLLWPFNVHFHLPLLDLARGGSLLTGLGGDQLFGVIGPEPRRTRARQAVHSALGYAPRAARAAVIASRRPLDAPWMLPAGNRAATQAMAAELGAEPRGALGARMAHQLSMRYLRVTQESLELCAGAGDVLLGNPLCAPALWGAVAQACSARNGRLDHERALRELFPGWLPEALVARGEKASFDEVFINSHARAFARDWDGTGVPSDLVDVGALGDHWRSEAPSCLSLTLMQAAWLRPAQLDDRPVGTRRLLLRIDRNRVL